MPFVRARYPASMPKWQVRAECAVSPAQTLPVLRQPLSLALARCRGRVRRLQRYILTDLLSGLLKMVSPACR